jgi:hypothetical protein
MCCQFVVISSSSSLSRGKCMYIDHYPRIYNTNLHAQVQRMNTIKVYTHTLIQKQHKFTNNLLLLYHMHTILTIRTYTGQKIKCKYLCNVAHQYLHFFFYQYAITTSYRLVRTQYGTSPRPHIYQKYYKYSIKYKIHQ